MCMVNEQLIKKHFGRNFGRAIEESDYRTYTLKQLGKLFGVSGTMVHYWRTGEKMPAMAQGVFLALKLAVNVEWLLADRGPMRIKEGISYHGASLLSAFESMTDEARREILAHAAFVADKFGDKLTSKELNSLAKGFQQDPSRPN